jgi:asparagine synthase (glutamine-hydrolysing)
VNFFLLLADMDGAPIAEEARRRYERAPCCAGLALTWWEAGPAAVLLARDDIGRSGLGPAVSRWDSYLAAGTVRLDNRVDVARWGEHPGTPPATLSDLDLIVRAVALRGERIIPELLGDFAFVIWDAAGRRLVAARDAFGVRRLCYRQNGRRFAFSSRAELLAEGDAYDIQPLVEMIAMCDPSPDRTVYAGVRAVPPASVVRGREGALAVSEYWSPENFEPAPVPAGKEGECYDAFRALFAESVRQRLTGEPDVWSQLSGGLDSSSVVSMAQWLAQRGEVPHGVAGTISWVYRWSTDGDEREYSDAVARHWHVRNEVMLNDWFWEDDGEPPPLTDEPDPEYVTWARERRTIRLIRANGGRVLLTGLGSDHYLLGNMFFFADWLSEGRVGDAIREMLRRAALGRVSFWNLAYQNAILPLLPRSIQRRIVQDAAPPAWVPASLVARVGARDTFTAKSYFGTRGGKYSHLVRLGMRSINSALRRNLIFDDWLDVRHPFLSRPLVEFGLRLAPEMCVQPHARKWVLRHAMQGILPDVVRTRVGKGANPGCIVQSLLREHRLVDSLLDDPVLGQLGCLDVDSLRAACAIVSPTVDDKLVIAVAHTLALETWLRVRSGRRIVAQGDTRAIPTGSSWMSSLRSKPEEVSV